MKNFSVTRNGEELDPSLYTWDEKTKTFSTNKDDLVLDFANWYGVTFKTGNNCTFKTGHSCTFNAGHGCTFDTDHWCTFGTGSYCTFNTDYGCTFDTGDNCTFDTGDNCTFKTGDRCTFKTGDRCTFKTGENCIVINRDTNEVIRLNNKENYYDTNEKHVTFEKDNFKFKIIRNNKELIVEINSLKLEDLKQFLSDKEYLNLQKEIFDKMT